MVAWPADLPCTFVGGSENYSEKDNLDVFETDYGPPLLGRHYTGKSAELSGEMRLTVAQRTSLMTFFRTTLKDGSLEFTMNNLLTDSTTKTCRLKPPNIRRVAARVSLASLTFTVLN